METTAEQVAELAMDAIRARYAFESTPENQAAAAAWTTPDARKARLKILAHARAWAVGERRVTVSAVPGLMDPTMAQHATDTDYEAARRHSGIAADAAEYARAEHPDDAVRQGTIVPISPYAYSLRW